MPIKKSYLLTLECLSCSRPAGQVKCARPNTRIFVRTGTRCGACGGSIIPSAEVQEVQEKPTLGAIDIRDMRRGPGRPPKWLQEARTRLEGARGGEGV